MIIKKKDGVQVQDSDIFTFLVSEIGETRDSKRFPLDQNDLIEATSLFNLFKTNNPLPKSKRCKTISFEEFDKMSHWLIDKLWSDSEKEQLGISEEKESITEEDFWGIVDDIQSYIKTIRGK